MVENGKSRAAHSICEANCRASEALVSELQFERPPSVPRHRAKGRAATVNRAPHSAAIAAAVRSRDFHRSGIANQAYGLKLHEEVINVCGDLALVPLKLLEQCSYQRISVAGTVD